MKNTDWAYLERYRKINEALLNQNVPNNFVVGMGDSITEFWQEVRADFFENNNLICRGIKGQTSSQMLLRFRQDVVELRPKAVVILAGINDIAENTGPITVKNIYGNIISMVQLAQANHISVILCSVLPAATIPWNAKINPIEKIIHLNNLLSNYARENRLPYVDYYKVMVTETFSLPSAYTEDGVHLTIAGYKKMENLLKPVLTSL
ncbi:Lysophospholipase L1 [Mesonia phycicola]|uniref:Lysophospholipase L1 n=1 Tax=Mesonia phycicola TaxID=579105 RepID=A0A1M6DTV7_9FLAO|nr:GDSL-type esterase/lipase family protein [Mesonia phycicola]SHI76560.1 Lysophospholipase L1 [Mesonia phycicola]